jgi:hypothetical protein
MSILFAPRYRFSRGEQMRRIIIIVVATIVIMAIGYIVRRTIEKRK